MASRSPKKKSAPPKAGKPKRQAPKRASGDKYDDIRADLERQRTELLGEATAMMNRTDVEAYSDLSDQASAEFDQSFVIRLKEREQKLLKKIDGALERIAKKTYGICDGCGEEIPYQRLKARPVTTLCIDCKTLQEEQERIRG